MDNIEKQIVKIFKQKIPAIPLMECTKELHMTSINLLSHLKYSSQLCSYELDKFGCIRSYLTLKLFWKRGFHTKII